MSLASFPRTEVVYDVDASCVPAKMVLTFRGPPTAPLAHSIDSSIKPPQKKPVARTTAQGKTTHLSATDEAELLKSDSKRQRQEQLRKCREQMMERGGLKALYGMVEQKVQSACMSTDQILEQKKRRLRELLLAEEVAYATEYVALCQQASANRQEELIKRALAVQEKAERERIQFAEEKLLQQKVMSCDPARPTLTQKQLKELKQDQLWQIQEKYALEEAQREQDRMYHDLMMKNILAMKENEEEIAKLTWKKQKEAKEAFLEQMKWKQEKEEAEKRLKEFERVQMEEEVQALKDAEAKGKQDQLKKKEKMKAEFRELLDREREIKERRKKEEEEIERTFNELLKLQAEKEKAASNKERLKRERDLFLEKSRELKQKQEEQEKIFDEMLQEFNEKQREQKDAERRRLRAAKEELFHNVLKGRQEQIKEKQEKERQEAERKRAEVEELKKQLEQQDKIREEYNRRCAEQRREYQNELLRQIQEVEEGKRRKKEEENEFVKTMKAKEEKEIEEVKAILKALPIFPKDHPMKTFVKQHPPKYPCLHPYM